MNKFNATLAQRIAILEEEHLTEELTEAEQERLHNIFEPFMTDELKTKTEAVINKIGKAPDPANRPARTKWLKDLFEEGRES